MAAYDPLKPSNITTDGATKTQRYFNNFFVPKYTVSQNTNDAILSYFEQQTGNTNSAILMAQSLINTAQLQNEDPLTVLNGFESLPQGQLSTVLTMFLNSNRVPTSLLGIQNQPRQNYLVSRTILT